MDFALATLALLPGIFSYALACAPRSRAIAPRDLTATLAATLGFTVLNFYLTSLCLKLILTVFDGGAPSLDSMASALLTGTGSSEVPTRESVVAALLEFNGRNALGICLLILVSWSTGLLGGLAGQRSLRALALAHLAPSADQRTGGGKKVDQFLNLIGVQSLFLPRGASCWLLVREKAKLLSDSRELEVYADITQGDDSVLFAGQVHQVIASPSGETLSIVLLKARRYRRSWRPTPHRLDSATGTAPPSVEPVTNTDEGPWKTIGQSEAFYMRGDCINNISYRVYGDPARDKYQMQGDWHIPEEMIRLVRRLARTTPPTGAPPEPGRPAATA